MPVYTYQVAIRDEGHWLRDYVCADDRIHAVYQFLESHPLMTLEFLLQSDKFEVERCD